MCLLAHPDQLRSRSGSSHQRIYDVQIGETAEIAVGGPEFTHAMLSAERGDPRVMNLRPRNSAGHHKRTLFWPMLLGLCEEHKSRGFEPCVNLVDRIGR